MPAISLPQTVPEWAITGVDGTRVVTMASGEHLALSRVLCSLATCQQSGQVGLFWLTLLKLLRYSVFFCSFY